MNIFQKGLRLSALRANRKALHAQNTLTENLYTVWDSQTQLYVLNLTDTELTFVGLNHCTFYRISCSYSLAVLRESETWSLMQGSKNRTECLRIYAEKNLEPTQWK